MKLEITEEELKLEDNIKKKVDIVCQFCQAYKIREISITSSDFFSNCKKEIDF